MTRPTTNATGITIITTKMPVVVADEVACEFELQASMNVWLGARQQERCVQSQTHVGDTDAVSEMEGVSDGVSVTVRDNDTVMDTVLDRDSVAVRVGVDEIVGVSEMVTETEGVTDAVGDSDAVTDPVVLIVSDAVGVTEVEADKDVDSDIVGDIVTVELPVGVLDLWRAHTHREKGEINTMSVLTARLRWQGGEATQARADTYIVFVFVAVFEDVFVNVGLTLGVALSDALSLALVVALSDADVWRRRKSATFSIDEEK